MHHSPARIVLVTGGSRGIGADVAQQLAGADTHVVVNYRQSAERAEAIAEAICGAGGYASTLRADIADEAESEAMIDTIASASGDWTPWCSTRQPTSSRRSTPDTRCASTAMPNGALRGWPCR